MRRFFFHLYDDLTVIDQEGQELPTLQSARERAVDDAREMICAEIQDGHLNLKHRIEVADGTGKVLLRVRFADTIEIEA